MPTPTPDSFNQVIDVGDILQKSLADSTLQLTGPLYLFWYISIFMILLVIARVIYWLYKRHRYSKAKISDIDKMTGQDFELYLTNLFSRLGYSVENTGGIGDMGVDLVIVKDEIRCAVQAKRHDKYIGVDAVQEVVAGMAPRYCKEGMVVTNNYFSKEARKLAKLNDVKLWDRNILVKNILKK